MISGPTSRGLTLVELMVVVAVGGLVLVPFAIFMVQMVTASKVSGEKLLLSTECHVASIAVRSELLSASGGDAYSSGSGPLALATDGDELRYIVGGLTRSMTLSGTDLTVTTSGVSRVLIDHVGSFVARKISVEEVEIEIELRSQTNAQTSTTTIIRVPMLNAIVGS